MLGLQYVVWFDCRDNDFLHDCYWTQFSCRLFQKVVTKLWKKGWIEEGIQSLLLHYLYFVILAPSSDLETALPITSRILGLTRLLLIQSQEQLPDTLFMISSHPLSPVNSLQRVERSYGPTLTTPRTPHPTDPTPTYSFFQLQFPVWTVELNEDGPRNVVLFNIQNSSPLLLCWSCALPRPTDLQ